MKKRILAVVLYIFAFLSLAYFLILIVTIGPAFRFNFVWLLMGLFFLSIALTISFSKRSLERIPKPVLLGIELLVTAGCLMFILVEGLIIRQSMKQPEEEADYLIVLGAKVNGKTPSRTLKYRIDKAAQYLTEHPAAKAVVSGGKGDDEGISEAEAMYEGLIKYGIAENRIYKEDQSTSTKENIAFSKRCIEENGGDIRNQNILIVTTDFHVLRAILIARKDGFENVEGAASRSVWYLVPTNYVREFLAVVKDKLVGNL